MEKDTYEVPDGSLRGKLQQFSSLISAGDMEGAGKIARESLPIISQKTRGTRLIAYGMLAQSPEFVLEDVGSVLAEASACLREEMKNPEVHLAAAWLFTAYGGEISPEERDRVLAAAEPFQKQPAKKKVKLMAMTIIAAHATDTEMVSDTLLGILAEKDERAIEIAFRRAARCFITEDQHRGDCLLQEAIEQAPSTRLRDQLRQVRGICRRNKRKQPKMRSSGCTGKSARGRREEPKLHPVFSGRV